MARRRTRVIIVLASVIAFLGVLLIVTFWETHRAEDREVYGERPEARKQVMAQAARQLVAPFILGGLAQREMIEGTAALGEIAHLHGKEVGLIDAVVFRYGSEKRGATLWIGWALNSGAAETLIQQMTVSIQAGKTPFKDLEETVIEGRAVYVLSGQGQRHAYFADGDRIVWVAVDASLFNRAMRDLLAWMRKT